MCEAAKNIQESWHVNFGDYYNDIEEVVEVVLSVVNVHKCKTTLIWLPRQDQLQEIVMNDTKTVAMEDRIIKLHVSFDRFVKYWAIKHVVSMNMQNYSMEQLWLSYTMYYLYEKMWVGNEWRIKQ